MKQYILATLLALISLPVFAATNVSVDGMVEIVIYLVVISLIFWAIWWFIGYVGVPEPFNKIIRVVMGLFALLIVLNLLLGMLGHPIVNIR